MKKTFNLFVVISLFLLLAGCHSTDDVLIKNADDVEIKKDNLGPELKYQTSDGYFEIVGFNGALTNFSVKNSQADIRDLAAFSTALYRSELASKLKCGEKLTPIDFQLLCFCVHTQISALNTYSRTGLQAMFPENKIPLINGSSFERDIRCIKIKSFGDNVREVENVMQQNFYHRKSLLRNKILDWGYPFQAIDKDVLAQDFLRIQKGSNQKVDDFQWRQIWVYIIPFLWNDKELFENRSLRPYKVYNADHNITSKQWKTLNMVMLNSIKDLKNIHDDIGKYILSTQDSRSKADLENLQLAMDYKMRSAVILNSFVFNDLPFAVFCKKYYIGIQNCKGTFNDSENQMEDLINEFIIRVNGADMLKLIRSPHTSDIYVQLLELIKSEFGDTRYKNYLTRTKLYELDAFAPSYFGENKVKEANAK